jgi:O-antigen/teichoic acid export membrane protein
MVFPLANALSFQGVTLLVGVVLGTSAVALFNTYRTIARVAVQLTGIFSHALAPELSRLFGEGGKTAVERIWLRSAKVGLIQAFGLSVVLYFLSPLLLKVWTHGRIEFIAPLMALMLLYAAVGGAGHIPRAMLSAVNQPKALAAWTIFTSLLVIGLAWLLGNWWQLYGVTLAILIAEALIALICTHLVYHSVLKSNYKLNF